MAIQFSASIYRINDYDLKSAQGIPAVQGITHAFPSAGVRIYAAPASTTANGVTMASVIATLPTGLNQPEKKFYSPTAVATLVTAANA